MKKYVYYLLALLLLAFTFAGCTTDTLEIAEEPPEEPPVEEAIPEDDEEDSDTESLLEDLFNELFGDGSGSAFLAETMTSEEMQAFEAEHAVSEAQERYLAFGAFLFVRNGESPRVLAVSAPQNRTVQMLRNSWSVTDHESAMEQLTRLANADGQSPIANDIFHTLVRNGELEPLDPFEMFFNEVDLSGLENVYHNAVNRAERMPDEFELFFEMLDVPEEYRDEAFELFVLFELTDRVNRGLEAYLGARDLLIDSFGFTEEELLSIESLNAWDYGRATTIARYGVSAGFLEEDEVWGYLKLAADSAAMAYNSWREYTAAYILGRALAFGNSSWDFNFALDFLLNHSESPFVRIPF